MDRLTLRFHFAFGRLINQLGDRHCSNPADHYGRADWASAETKAGRALRDRYVRASNYLLARARRQRAAQEANERLDRLAGIPSSAEGKNHVHACRPGHPLGRGNAWKWRTAFATVTSRQSFLNSADRADLDWLRQRADEERGA